MGRKSLEERHHRTLTKVAGGRSLAVTLPKEFLEELGWDSGDNLKVSIRKRQGRLVIEKLMMEEI